MILRACTTPVPCTRPLSLVMNSRHRWNSRLLRTSPPCPWRPTRRDESSWCSFTRPENPPVLPRPTEVDGCSRSLSCRLHGPLSKIHPLDVPRFRLHRLGQTAKARCASAERMPPPRAAYGSPSSRALTSATAVLPVGSRILQRCRTRFVSFPPLRPTSCILRCRRGLWLLLPRKRLRFRIQSARISSKRSHPSKKDPPEQQRRSHRPCRQLHTTSLPS